MRMLGALMLYGGGTVAGASKGSAMSGDIPSLLGIAIAFVGLLIVQRSSKTWDADA